MKTEPLIPEPLLSDEEWEGLCKGCGRCCYEKLEEDDGTVIYTDIPCPFLDTDTGHCLVYSQRLEYMPDCLDLKASGVENLYWLPDECGYVEYIRRTRGPDAFRRKATVIF